MNVVRLLRPGFKWAACRALVGRYRCRGQFERGRFTRRDVIRILDHTWLTYARLSSDLPREPTLGSRLNVMLGCLTVSLYDALRSAGVDREYAVELVSDVCWKIYEQWGRLALWLARLSGRGPKERIRLMLRTFLRFPFNRPGYQYEVQETEAGVSTHFTRCPVADYMNSLDLGFLCQGTWCTLDYPLAELWGGRYGRTKTLSAGDRLCDMLWSSQRSPDLVKPG